jgi:D-aspartate ligase
MVTSHQLDPDVPVLVFKIGSLVIHHGAVGIVRSLGRLGVPMYALIEDPYTPLAWCRYLSRSFAMNWNSGGGVLRRLLAIGESVGRHTILVPTDDQGAIFIAENAKELSRYFLFPDVPRELPRLLANKMTLYARCKAIGVPCPEYALISSSQELREFVARASFPLLVKTADHSQPVDDRHSSFVVESREHLFDFYADAERMQRKRLILQDFVPGEDWIYHGYCNEKTNLYVGYTGRKLRSYPAFAGPTTLGVSIHNEGLSRQTEVLLRSVKYSGIMDLDYRFDERDEQFKLVDFNPRIGANFRMFEDQAGNDVARALHLDLTGRRICRSSMIEGRKFIAEPYDVFTSFVYLRRGGLTMRAWWQSLAGRREFAWWSVDDPLPMAVMIIRLTLRVAGRAMRSIWTSTGLRSFREATRRI